MAISSLKGVITEKFITVASKVGTSEDTGKNIAKSLTGQGQATTLDTTLRLGARNFALGLQALNRGISFVNFSRATHEKLDGLTTSLLSLVDKASKSSVGGQTAKNILFEFRNIAKEFEDTIEKGKIEDDSAFDVEGITNELIKAGLDPDKIPEIAELMKKLHSLSHTEVDENGKVITGDSLIPIDQFAKSLKRAVGQDDEDLDSKSEFFSKIRDSLTTLRTSIRENIKYLDRTVELVGKNMDLVRAAGNAFLDKSYQIKGTEKAESVADQLREEVRRNAPGALSQAANLQGILVAGVTLAGQVKAEQSK